MPHGAAFATANCRTTNPAARRSAEFSAPLRLTETGRGAGNFGISEILFDGKVEPGILRFGPVPNEGFSFRPFAKRHLDKAQRTKDRLDAGYRCNHLGQKRHPIAIVLNLALLKCAEVAALKGDDVATMAARFGYLIVDPPPLDLSPPRSRG